MPQSKEYTITIKTEHEWGDAGTKSKLSMQIVGEKRESEWKVLSDESNNVFDLGKVAEFKMTCDNLGKLLLVRIKLDHGENKTDNWSAETITVKHDDKEDLFPLNEFVSADVEVANSKYNLPQKLEHDALKLQRKTEIEFNKKKYIWTKTQGQGVSKELPRYLEGSLSDIPREFHMKDMSFDYFKITSINAKQNAAMEMKENAGQPWDDMDIYKTLFSHPTIDGTLPKYIEEAWETDEEFGRQILTGINPVVVQRCVKLPKGCNITNDHIVATIPDDSLDDAINSERLFMVNHFETAKDVERNINFNGDRAFAADALCLFYAFEDGKFLPIAIQLKADDPESIFTPNDEKYDWMLAKMHFRCIDISMFEWITHLLKTHFILEPITIATFRCLPRSHPVHKLLRPHVRTVPAINYFGRLNILPHSQKAFSINAVHLATKYFKDTFSFTDLDIPQLLRKNATMCKDKLKNYHYRDDAIKMWEMVMDYVDDVIKHFYDCNDDVKNDHEIQDWIHEIGMEGYGWFDGNSRGVPTTLDNIDQLVWFCTVVIFTSSAQHAAINFGQFDICMFIPNAPGTMHQPIHKRGEGSMKKIMATLPDLTHALGQISLLYHVSLYTPYEVYLGQFPDTLFGENKMGKIQEKFRKNLAKFSADVDERNKSLKYPYEYLKPERIPSSTAR